MASVHNQISRLRTAMGSSAICTHPTGYSLAEEVSVDLRCFDIGPAVESLSLSEVDVLLGLASQEPLSEFAFELWAMPTAVRVVEQRYVLREARIRLLLAENQGDVAAIEADGLLRLQPLRESACALLMEALSRQGRTADALRAFETFRKNLADTTGLGPSVGLIDCERSVVRGELTGIQRNAPRGFVPRPTNTLIGRDGEVTLISALLQSQRCLTLVGAGGIGKTRLAIEIAQSFETEFSDGVWFVDLAVVKSGSDVATAVAAAIRVSAGIHGNPLGALVSWLEHRTMLIVIDNCEHVLLSVAEMVSAILQRCVGVRILATSREALAINGEQRHRVLPLSIGDAAELFIERARNVRSDILFGPVALEAVSSICTAVDGLPLAVELAAGRCDVATPEEIRTSIEKNFEEDLWLRDTSSRHQTMRAAIEWSWALLNETERTVMLSTSIFVGGFSADAAQRVVGMRQTPPADVAKILGALVRKSLLVLSEVSGTSRYRMFEPVRRFAEEQLDLTADAVPVRRRHAEWAIDRLRVITALLASPREIEGAALRAVESPNIFAARRWAISQGDTELVMAFVDCFAVMPLLYGAPHAWMIIRFSDVEGVPGVWDHRSTPALWAHVANHESGRSPDAALDAANRADVDGAPTLVRIKARMAASFGALLFGRADVAREQMDRAIALVGETDDLNLIGLVANAPTVLTFGGRKSRSEGREAADRSAMPSLIARSLYAEALAAQRAGRHNEALSISQRAFTIAESVGNDFIKAILSESFGVSSEPGGRLVDIANSLPTIIAAGLGYLIVGLTNAVGLLAAHGCEEEAAELAGSVSAMSRNLVDKPSIGYLKVTLTSFGLIIRKRSTGEDCGLPNKQLCGRSVSCEQLPANKVDHCKFNCLFNSASDPAVSTDNKFSILLWCSPDQSTCCSLVSGKKEVQLLACVVDDRSGCFDLLGLSCDGDLFQCDCKTLHRVEEHAGLLTAEATTRPRVFGFAVDTALRFNSADFGQVIGSLAIVCGSDHQPFILKQLEGGVHRTGAWLPCTRCFLFNALDELVTVPRSF
jgi:predicted ATPase/DNA-binding SARP family transcriptional activator